MKGLRITVLALVATVSLFYSGCSQNASVPINEESQKLIEELKIENKNLKDTLDKHKQELTNQPIINITDENKIKELHDNYPTTKKINASTMWDKIVVSNEVDSVIITDVDMLRGISSLFYLRRDVTMDYPNGPRYLESFKYVFTSDKDEITIYVRDNNVIEIEGIPNRIFQSDNNIFQLGRAFLKEQQFYTRTEKNTFEKILHSGMMIIGTQMKAQYFDKVAIIGSAYGLDFLNTGKDEISKPIKESEEIERWTYYYYGQQIEVRFFENYISVQDGNNKRYFSKDSEEIKLQISFPNYY